MKKILLIEDNNEIRENTAEILELSGYKVFTAPNGKEGISLAQAELPDLIICDIMMPVLDGYGVLHLLSKNKNTAGIPFIFLTAKSERVDFRKGMEMGADDYITKPFDDIELLNAIESRLKKADLMKREFASAHTEQSYSNDIKGLEMLTRLTENQSETTTYKKKERVYKEGSYPKGLFFVCKGKIKTYKTHDSGKELITGLYTDGDYLGYMSLMDDSKYTDTAEVMEESSISFIPKDDFFSLLHKNAQVSRKFIKMLSSNLAEKEEQLINLAYNSVRKRVADALTTLYNTYSKEGEVPFSIHMSREDLANLAGTATETTIRTLGDFKEEKLVDMKGSVITLLNPKALARLRN